MSNVPVTPIPKAGGSSFLEQLFEGADYPIVCEELEITAVGTDYVQIPMAEDIVARYESATLVVLTSWRETSYFKVAFSLAKVARLSSPDQLTVEALKNSTNGTVRGFTFSEAKLDSSSAQYAGVSPSIAGYSSGGYYNKSTGLALVKLGATHNLESEPFLYAKAFLIRKKP